MWYIIYGHPVYIAHYPYTLTLTNVLKIMTDFLMNR